MTVINPNSVAGINSITVQSGNSLSVHKSNGELIRTLTSSSGVSTFSSLSVGTATTDNSAAKSINIGLGASISQHADNSLSLGTGGDERFRIDANGDINLGNNPTNQFGYKLNIQDSAIIYAQTASSGGLEAKWHLDNSAELMEFGTVSTDDLALVTTNIPRVRIDSGGDVGIGTDTMNAPLTVVNNDSAGYIASFRQKHSSNSAQIIIDSPSDSNVRPTSIDLAQAGTVKWSLGQAYASTSSQAFHIATSSLQANENGSKLIITTSGNTGIGTINPSKTLTIFGASSSSFRISKSGVLAYDHTFDGSTYTIANNNGSAGIPIVIGTKTAGGESVRIDAAGKMGIGNNSPSFLLDLKATSSADVLRLGNTAESSHGNADVKLVAGGSYYQNFDFQASSYKIQTYNGSSLGERFRVASAGQLGIGGANYGTSGQVLTSQGSSSAPTWGSAGGIVPITATTVSSETSAVAFTEALTGAFDTYKIYIVMIDGMKFAADDRDLRVRYRTGSNGGTLATGSDYHSMTNGANNADDAFSANSFWRMNYNNISNVTVGSYIKGDFNAIIYFQGFEANRRLRYYGMTSYQSADGDDRGQFISGMATDATEATGLEFFSSSGNIALGKFSLFGVNG